MSPTPSEREVRDIVRRLVSTLTKSYQRKLESYIQNSPVPPTGFEFDLKSQSLREEICTKFSHHLNVVARELTIFTVADMEHQLEHDLEKVTSDLRACLRRASRDFQMKISLGGSQPGIYPAQDPEEVNIM